MESPASVFDIRLESCCCFFVLLPFFRRRYAKYDSPITTATKPIAAVDGQTATGMPEPPDWPRAATETAESVDTARLVDSVVVLITVK